MKPVTSRPLVSIGLPYCADERFIARAIASILNQSYGEFELIIIGDGSTDRSAEIVDTFSDRRIIHLKEKANLGLASRLNQITQLARGEIIFRMDADDIMFPDRVAVQVATLKQAGPKAVVGSTAIEIDDQDNPAAIISASRYRGTGFRARHSFIHPTISAHRQWFLEHPYATTPIFRRCQDAELWVRAAAESEFINLDRPLLFYRRISQEGFDKFLWQAMAILKILDSEKAGPLGLRLFYAAQETAKLYFRFIQRQITHQNPAPRGPLLSQAEVQKFEQIIEEATKR